MAETKKKYWQLAAPAVLKELDTRPQGLDFFEAKQRRLRFGRNEIRIENTRTAFDIFISQFKSPLILILLVASAISGFLGEISSTVIIVSIIICSAGLSFYMEYKSELAIKELRKRVALKATVIRSNKTKTINATELVLGDIVILNLGKVVPADLRLIETDDLSINESTVTGESFPVEKIVEPLPTIENYLPQALVNYAFTGTSVVGGHGTGVVVATGRDTEIGQTAHLLQNKQAETEFQKGIRNFGSMLIRVIVVFTVCIFLFLALFKHNVTESLLFSLAIAVGISPELLPIIITINLSRGARQMAKKSVIVKRLMSIEDLGNIDVLCTDKTGTLTEGKIFLDGYYNFNEENDPEILEIGWYCNSLTVAKELMGNPLDEAIINFVKKEKFEPELAPHGCRIIDTLAFDFSRRRMSVVGDCSAGRILYCKGAVEETLKACTQVKIGGQTRPLAGELLKIRNKLQQLEQLGLRLVLVAKKEIDVKAKYTPADEKDLVLLGYLAFSDQPKLTAKESILAMQKLGIEIKILTGDSDLTAAYICKQLGCMQSEILLGSALEAMNDEQLRENVNQYGIFARITPQHKLRIINALNAAGHTVGFLGDGVNDAPALRAADVGISVDTAIDVAKEAADVVLLEKDLNVLVDGIIEGRRTFGNTLKYIFSTISSNFGNMFSVAGTALFLPYIPMLPQQILLLNFLSDFPMLAISSDKVDEEYYRKPKHWDIKMISKFMTRFGLISSFFDYITFGVLLYYFNANMSLFQTGWLWESYLTEVAIIFIIRTRKWFWQSRASLTLIVSTLLTTVLVLGVIYLPINKYFSLMPLPLPMLLILALITVIYFVFVEIGKKVFFKKFNF
jgi:Mg2+-importing ATPase